MICDEEHSRIRFCAKPPCTVEQGGTMPWVAWDVSKTNPNDFSYLVEPPYLNTKLPCQSPEHAVHTCGLADSVVFEASHPLGPVLGTYVAREGPCPCRVELAMPFERP